MISSLELEVEASLIPGKRSLPCVRANWQALKARQPNSPAIAKMARLGERLSPETGKSTDYYGEALVAILAEWVEQLNLPRLSTYGVSRKNSR